MFRTSLVGVCALFGALLAPLATTAVHAASTKTYTSTSCGYTVRYPSVWSTKTEKSDVLFGTANYNVRISCAKGSNVSINTWFTQAKKNLSKDGKIIKSEHIKNQALIDVQIKKEVDRFFAQMHGNTLYVLQYAAVSKSVFNANIGSFRTMLNSITFK